MDTPTGAFVPPINLPISLYVTGPNQIISPNQATGPSEFSLPADLTLQFEPIPDPVYEIPTEAQVNKMSQTEISTAYGVLYLEVQRAKIILSTSAVEASTVASTIEGYPKLRPAKQKKFQDSVRVYTELTAELKQLEEERNTISSAIVGFSIEYDNDISSLKGYSTLYDSTTVALNTLSTLFDKEDAVVKVMQEKKKKTREDVAIAEASYKAYQKINGDILSSISTLDQEVTIASAAYDTAYTQLQAVMEPYDAAGREMEDAGYAIQNLSWGLESAAGEIGQRTWEYEAAVQAYESANQYAKTRRTQYAKASQTTARIQAESDFNEAERAYLLDPTPEKKALRDEADQKKTEARTKEQELIETVQTFFDETYGAEEDEINTYINGYTEQVSTFTAQEIEYTKKKSQAKVSRDAAITMSTAKAQEYVDASGDFVKAKQAVAISTGLVSVFREKSQSAQKKLIAASTLYDTSISSFSGYTQLYTSTTTAHSSLVELNQLYRESSMQTQALYEQYSTLAGSSLETVSTYTSYYNSTITKIGGSDAVREQMLIQSRKNWCDVSSNQLDLILASTNLRKLDYTIAEANYRLSSVNHFSTISAYSNILLRNPTGPINTLSIDGVRIFMSTADGYADIAASTTEVADFITRQTIAEKNQLLTLSNVDVLIPPLQVRLEVSTNNLQAQLDLESTQQAYTLELQTLIGLRQRRITFQTLFSDYETLLATLRSPNLR
jgi:hypothetical protein